MIISKVTYNPSFQVAQITGSAALEGIVVSETMKNTAFDVISGKITADEATQAIIARYKSKTSH
jgi:hypothetical protein